MSTNPRTASFPIPGLAARIPGLAQRGADLADTDTVIEAARHWFEERRTALALEILQLAAEECPQDPAPKLAALEFRFLMGDRAAFIAAARAFDAAHPK